MKFGLKIRIEEKASGSIRRHWIVMQQVLECPVGFLKLAQACDTIKGWQRLAKGEREILRPRVG